MALPDVSVATKDGALGFVASTDSDKMHAKVGTCSLGSTSDILVTSDPQTVQDTFGTGPLVDSGLDALSVENPGPVLLCKAPSSTAGAAGSTTLVGTGTGTVPASGAALDAYNVKVKILTTGTNIAAGTATFQYSLDGGITWSPVLAVPTGGVYVIAGTGVTLTFTNGMSGTSFIAGDVYSFTTTAPSFTVSEMGVALDAIFARVEDPFAVHILGAAADMSGAAAQIAALQAKLATAFNGKRYLRGVVELPDVADSLITAAMASVVADRVLAVGGYLNLVSQLNGVAQKRSLAWPLMSRASQVRQGIDLARTKDGPLANVQGILRDERKTQALDAARVASARTFIRKPGFYITNAPLLSSPGSDFRYLQHGRVIDTACAATYDALVDYLSDDLEVDAKSGLILEYEARAIENACERKMKDRLVDGEKQVSAVEAVVDRTVNIISTQNVPVSIRVTPKAYAKTFTATVAFANPKLALVA